MPAPGPDPTVAALAERVWQYRLEREPFTRLRVGLPVDRLRSGSLEDVEADAAFARAVLRELDGLHEPQLAEDDRLTVGFVRFLLSSWVEAPEHHWHRFSVTPYSSFFLGFFLQQVFSAARLETAADVDRYLSLVADYRDFVREMGGKLDGQRERGILVPRPALAGVRASLTGYRDAAAAVLSVPADRTARLPRPDAARLDERLASLVHDEVSRAYDDILSRLDERYEQDAPSTVGAAHLPGGEDFYRAAVRMHTASDRTPEELHATGREQVQALSEEMAKARAAMGVTVDEQEFHAQLAVDPALHAEDSAGVERVYRRHMAALEPHLPTLFARLPRAPYDVRPLPASMSAGMTYGYYQVPTPLDPTGYYVYNATDLDKRSLLTAAALILHELAPGHHFHMARQSEDDSLPDIRRQAMDIGAFNEGWAEYAAGLGWEVGLYDEPLDGYGRLVHERFIAQRLVVDTGLNLYGWDLDRARAYMKANTTESDVQVATETLRYATDLPGQALAYRAGFLELQDIRRHAEQVLGERFDVREFHEQVLGPGALPFPVLREHVDRWARA